jgi:phosphinothricin acetyltransferase
VSALEFAIRDATADDLPSVLAIYNDVIATSTAIYRETPVTLDDRTAWWDSRRAEGYPVLVAVRAGEVLGFASFGDFRAWPGYRFTVEHTVHVRGESRGRGVGSALMPPLFERARALGKHVMVAGVDAGNAASLRFHERLGFERVAHFREVGFKFGRWLDLVFLQRWLDRA